MPEELDNRWIIMATQRFSARLECAPGAKGHPGRTGSQPGGAEQTGLASEEEAPGSPSGSQTEIGRKAEGGVGSSRVPAAWTGGAG